MQAYGEFLAPPPFPGVFGTLEGFVSYRGRKMTEKGSFAGRPAGCSRAAQLSRRSSATKLFFFAPFLLPILETVGNTP